MCTGQLPFKGKDTMAMLLALASQTPESPREIDPELPASLCDFIMRLLSKNPDRRPRSAREVVGELERIERELTQPGSAIPVRAQRQGAMAEDSGKSRRGVVRSPSQERQSPDEGRRKRKEGSDPEIDQPIPFAPDAETQEDPRSQTETVQYFISRK